jgi:hypothetical protein
VRPGNGNQQLSKVRWKHGLFLVIRRVGPVAIADPNASRLRAKSKEIKGKLAGNLTRSAKLHTMGCSKE